MRRRPARRAAAGGFQQLAGIALGFVSGLEEAGSAEVGNHLALRLSAATVGVDWRTPRKG